MLAHTASLQSRPARFVLGSTTGQCSSRNVPVLIRSAVFRPSTTLFDHSRSRRVEVSALPVPIPVEVLAGGIAAAGALIGGVWYGMTQNQQPEQPVQQEPQPVVEPPREPENAVLVLGATGRTGQVVVKQLVAAGREVVAGVRTQEKFTQIYGEEVQPTLFPKAVDVTNKQTLTADLFKGVSQVVLNLGPVFGRLPDGSFGFLDGMSSERVEAQGIANVVEAVSQFVPKQEPSADLLVPLKTAEDLAVWDRLDDVIMGGQSSSSFELSADGTGVVWKGDLIVEGGGFCGTRSKKLSVDWSGYDGLQLRVRADGQTFKVNIKTTDQEEVPESTYQATFDTAPGGDWVTVQIPWHNFVPVKQARSIPEGQPLDPSKIARLGLVYSRFQFNKLPNPKCKPGPFELHIDGGISAFKAPKPQVVMVSSACVERNAIIGDDAEKRKNSGVPIVRLNPGGTLNHKYFGENAIRASGYPYTIIRPTGLDSSADSAAVCLLEAQQGDTINGTIKREEVADLVVKALSLPDAVNKTFEVRRNAAPSAQGVAMQGNDYLRLYLTLATDSERWRVGLQPLPLYVPPPPPPTEEEKAAVLADPRVQAVAARDRQRVENRVGQELPAQEGQAAQPASAEAEKEVVKA